MTIIIREKVTMTHIHQVSSGGLPAVSGQYPLVTFLRGHLQTDEGQLGAQQPPHEVSLLPGADHRGHGPVAAQPVLLRPDVLAHGRHVVPLTAPQPLIVLSALHEPPELLNEVVGHPTSLCLPLSFTIILSQLTTSSTFTCQYFLFDLSHGRVWSVERDVGILQVYFHCHE